jgi:hypothetical protein
MELMECKPFAILFSFVGSYSRDAEQVVQAASPLFVRPQTAHGQLACIGRN